MDDLQFRTNTTPEKKREYLRRIQVPLSLAILLSGFLSIGGVVILAEGITAQVWESDRFVTFCYNLLFCLIAFCSFLSLIKIIVDEKPFSKTLTVSMNLIAVLTLLASFLFPRIPGYVSSGFEILRLSADFILLDGKIFLTGLFLLILSRLIGTGFEMQKEMEEIL